MFIRCNNLLTVSGTMHPNIEYCIVWRVSSAQCVSLSNITLVAAKWDSSIKLEPIQRSRIFKLPSSCPKCMRFLVKKDNAQVRQTYLKTVRHFSDHAKEISNWVTVDQIDWKHLGFLFSGRTFVIAISWSVLKAIRMFVHATEKKCLKRTLW